MHKFIDACMHTKSCKFISSFTKAAVKRHISTFSLALEGHIIPEFSVKYIADCRRMS